MALIPQYALGFWQKGKFKALRVSGSEEVSLIQFSRWVEKPALDQSKV